MQVAFIGAVTLRPYTAAEQSLFGNCRRGRKQKKKQFYNLFEKFDSFPVLSFSYTMEGFDTS